MTVEALINSIRYKVGDIKKTKWTDGRIIELINEGLKDLASKVEVKKVETSLPILPYQRKLTIPDSSFINLLRVKVDRVPLKIVPFDKLDKILDWENKISDKITLAAYNKQNSGEITLYPLLDEASTDYEALANSTGVVVDIPNVDRDYLYGIITSLGTLPLITPTNVYDPSTIDTTGTLTGIQDTFVIADIIYSAVPDLVTTSTVNLDLSDNYVTTIVYYVSGMLLLDDTRAESVNKGTTFIQKYNSDLEVDRNLTLNSYQAIVPLEVQYRTGF